MATLSESGASLLKPANHEDIFRLGAIASPPAGANAPAAAVSLAPAPGSPVPLDRTRNFGFSYQDIRTSLLGPAVNVPPDACQNQCISDSRCAAWEVCAPIDPQSG